MSSVNVGLAKKPTTPAVEELTRAIMSCFLWENSFYESGSDLASRIETLVSKVTGEELCALVIQAREDMNIRHAPLFIIVNMLKYPHLKGYVKNLLARVIKRPDDATETLAMYWKDGKKPLAAQLKKGLALALPKFNEYQLAKYQNKGSLKLRDVFNIVHPRPKDAEQAKLWKKLMTTGLNAPNTWEVRLSAGEDKNKVFTELLQEDQLGALAYLRNLRNMVKAGVDRRLIAKAGDNINFEKVLPFRFIAAASAAPELETMIEKQMMRVANTWDTLKGKTVLLIDISGSMLDKLSTKSDMRRLDAAAALAILLRNICHDVEVFVFNAQMKAVPARNGFALRDAIVNGAGGGTYLGKAIQTLNETVKAERLIVITDEESQDKIADPKFAKPYMINVSSYENNFFTDKWIRMNGFSEKIIDVIKMMEG